MNNSLPMNKEQRDKVTIDQIERFFASYYSSWRLQQILTIEKLLNEKYNFFPAFISETKQTDDFTGEATIAQEITNGLILDAISTCVQYAQNLFALLKAGENKDFFIRDIQEHDVSKIDTLIKQNTDEEKLCELFHFPYYREEFENKPLYIMYTGCVSRLHNWINEIKDFYINHEFINTQYKHGLTVALRPYALYTEKQIQESKNNKFNQHLVVFENLALNKLKAKDDNLKGYHLMPCFTDNVRPHIQELIQEDNMVRYVFPPADTDIEKIKSIAFKIRDCINAFASNIIRAVKNNHPHKRQLPSPERGKPYKFTFDVLPEIIKE
jgi:hypothetical protein